LRRRRRPQRIRKKRKVPIEPDDWVEYRARKRKKKMEEGAEKSNSGPIEENLAMTTT
jgi:hypothetical protein